MQIGFDQIQGPDRPDRPDLTRFTSHKPISTKGIRGDPSYLSSGAESQSTEVVATFSSYLGERDDDLQFFAKVPDNLSTNRRKLNDRMQIASKCKNQSGHVFMSSKYEDHLQVGLLLQLLAEMADVC